MSPLQDCCVSLASRHPHLSFPGLLQLCSIFSEELWHFVQQFEPPLPGAHAVELLKFPEGENFIPPLLNSILAFVDHVFSFSLFFPVLDTPTWHPTFNIGIVLSHILKKLDNNTKVLKNIKAQASFL